MDKKSRELVMAKLYFKNKDYKMAEKSFEQYLSQAPEDVSALKLLAQVYEQCRKFDKAFELYEKCYLVEPERTGVLLDICRILITNETILDVDYRKWFNLAIRAFPQNPIVANFKAFISTLPLDSVRETPKVAEEVTVAPYESTKISPNLIEILNRIEKRLDPIEKRLESIESKLSNLSLEKRFDKIEDKLSNLNISPKKADNNINHIQTKTPVASPQTYSALDMTPKVNNLQPIVPASTSAFTPPAPQANLGSLFSANLNLNSNTMPAATTTSFGASPFNFSSNLFADSMHKFNATTQAPPSAPTPGPAASTFSPGPISKFSASLSQPQVPTQTQSLFSSATPAQTTSPFSTNLFSESMKKYNIPNTFSFSPSSKPKEVEEEKEKEEEEEVAPNEELPIENTCDMQPIDYKTGEEDEDIVFEHRCKLFRFRDKEYKERGLGNIKVLKHKQTGKARLIMRRDAIGLVCLNCWDCSKIEQVKENQVRFTAVDASDGQAEGSLFLIKFKLKETTDIFRTHLETLFDDEARSTNTSISSPQSKPIARGNSTNDEVELVDPKLDHSLVEKARGLFLPDLFYHKLKNQEPCEGCNGCEKDD